MLINRVFLSDPSDRSRWARLCRCAGPCMLPCRPLCLSGAVSRLASSRPSGMPASFALFKASFPYRCANTHIELGEKQIHHLASLSDFPRDSLLLGRRCLSHLLTLNPAGTESASLAAGLCLYLPPFGGRIGCAPPKPSAVTIFFKPLCFL